MVALFANSEDPDQMPHSTASDLGLHCLRNTLLGVSDYNGLRYNILKEGYLKCCIQRKMYR